MATGQLGIKQLLDAEQKAQEIVNIARKEKVALIKKAQDDAEREINEYKAQRQAEFEGYERTHLAGTQGYQTQLAIQTDEQIKTLDAQLKKSGSQVVDLLLKLLQEVDSIEIS